MDWMSDNAMANDQYDDNMAGKASLLGWQIAGICLLIVGILARYWSDLTHAGLYVEDALLFNAYYGHEKALAEIFHSHIGQRYLTVFADLFAWIYGWANVRWQPWLYQWTGFVVTVCAISLFSFSGMIRNRILLLVAPLLLGMLGLNHLYYYNTLIYIMYTGVLMLLILLLYPSPQTPFAFTVQLFLVLFLPWSGPYSVLVLPTTIFLFFSAATKAKKVLHLAAFCSTLAYCLTVTGSNLKLSHARHLWIIERYLFDVLDKIILFDFFSRPHLAYWIVLLLALLFIWFLQRHDQEYITKALPLLLWIFMSIALFFISVKFAQYSRMLGSHQVIASFSWVAFLLYTGDRLVGRARPVVPAFFAVFLLSLVVFDSIRNPDKWHFTLVPAVQKFIDTVAYYEQQGLMEKKQSVCLYMPFLPGSVMAPRVVVGDRGPTALKLGPGDVEITTGIEFVCHRVPANQAK